MKKDVWVNYNEYEEAVNEILVKELGHSNRLSQDVMSKKPDSILQSLILLDILTELKNFNNKIDKLVEVKEDSKEVKKPIKTANK